MGQERNLSQIINSKIKTGFHACIQTTKSFFMHLWQFTSCIPQWPLSSGKHFPSPTLTPHQCDHALYSHTSSWMGWKCKLLNWLSHPVRVTCYVFKWFMSWLVHSRFLTWLILSLGALCNHTHSLASTSLANRRVQNKPRKNYERVLNGVEPHDSFVWSHTTHLSLKCASSVTPWWHHAHDEVKILIILQFHVWRESSIAVFATAACSYI